MESGIYITGVSSCSLLPAGDILYDMDAGVPRLVNIYPDALRLGKYPSLFTSTSVNNCLLLGPSVAYLYSVIGGGVGTVAIKLFKKHSRSLNLHFI